MLKGAGGTLLALPFLESFHVRAAEKASRKCLVAINVPLGMYAPALYPEEITSTAIDSEYLASFGDLRDKMTLFSGLYHPGVSHGHVNSSRIFTGTPNLGGSDPRLAKNGESFDQCAARQIGDLTRFSSLSMAMGGGQYSWMANGMAIPAEGNLSRVFKKLFVSDSTGDIDIVRQRLAAKNSVLDAVLQQSKSLKPALSRVDSEKLDEYFHAIRETEKRVAKDNAWLDTPKPKVDKSAAPNPATAGNFVGTLRNQLDLTHLALQTDSTRIVTSDIFNQGTVAIDGVNNGYHNLSHHGQDPENIRQLKLIENTILAEVQAFIQKLDATKEASGESLLDNTFVLLVSNLGNASSHSADNLPAVLFGGGLKHGRHLRFGPVNTVPMCNLFLTILNQMGVKETRFGTSTGVISQLV